MAHAIVIHDALDNATLYETTAVNGSKGRSWRPLARRRVLPREADPHFLTLRIEARDLLLDVLEAKMR